MTAALRCTWCTHGWPIDMPQPGLQTYHPFSSVAAVNTAADSSGAWKGGTHAQYSESCSPPTTVPHSNERALPPLLHTVSPSPHNWRRHSVSSSTEHTHTRTICKKLNTRAATARRKGTGSSGKTGPLLYTERKKKGGTNLCVCIYVKKYDTNGAVQCSSTVFRHPVCVRALPV